METVTFSTTKGQFTGEVIKENNKTVVVSFPNPGKGKSKESVLFIKRHKKKHNVICQEAQIPS